MQGRQVGAGLPRVRRGGVLTVGHLVIFLFLMLIGKGSYDKLLCRWVEADRLRNVPGRE